MFIVYFTNCGYSVQEKFATVEAALAYGKGECFECSIWRNGQLIATWSPIGGTRYFGRA